MNDAEIRAKIQSFLGDTFTPYVREETLPGMHEHAQTWLLLKILERLERLDETLSNMDMDAWNRHNP